MEAFRTVGTCARQILFEVDENNILTDLKFIGGCAGGLQAISKLAVGQNIDRIIELCKGIQCKNGTSCPDQLATALSSYKKHLEDIKNGIVTLPHRGPPLKFTIHVVTVKKQ